MRKALVFGVDRSNYNYKKCEGIRDAFISLGYETHYHLQHLNASELKSYGEIDVIFTEWDYRIEKFENVKNVIFWCNMDITKKITLAKNNPQTNIILAPKSYMFDLEVNQAYNNICHTDIYQSFGHEGQNLNVVNMLLSNNSLQRIDLTTYQLGNFYFSYMPCTLSDPCLFETVKEARYKFGYFGTGRNRPQIQAIYNVLKQDSFYKDKLIFNFVENGVISPEECISYYKETEYVLHVQVNPVLLEYPVRAGEATANGCKILLIEELPLYEKAINTGLIPEMIKFNSANNLLNEITNIPVRSFKERQNQARNFNHTYLESISRLEKFFK